MAQSFFFLHTHSFVRCKMFDKSQANSWVGGWWGEMGVQWLLSREPGSPRVDHLSTNTPHNTGLLLHTVLSICIGTHRQKNIRLTGASIVFPGACWSPSTLIIHGHVHDGRGQQLCHQQADRHRYGPALLSLNVLFYYVLKRFLHMHSLRVIITLHVFCLMATFNFKRFTKSLLQHWACLSVLDFFVFLVCFLFQFLGL